MDFFDHQDRARRRTLWLVLWFVVSLVVLVSAVNAAAYGITTLAQGGDVPDAGETRMLLTVTTLVILLLVLLGSVAKTSSLSKGGGAAVAHQLGGREVTAGNAGEADRQLLNVVEEMSLASGVPMPRVFVLENQNSINAFAAGLKPGDAVVAVTRGTLDQLNRDELQGVVAHEFSHILNGDMRLNLKLIGLVHGILILAIAGRIIMYTLRHVRVRGKAGAVIGVVFLVGLTLFVLGYVGYFAGILLRAAVNRQREYLADAAAVQFTRNPRGLSGAFQKLLGHGSQVKAANTAEMSHLFFGNALRRPIFGFLATHPPLEDRLDRIEPGWRDAPVAQRERTRPEARPAPRRAPAGHAPIPIPIPIPGVGTGAGAGAGAVLAGGAIASALSPADAARVVGRIEATSPEVGHAALAALPTRVRAACADPFSARAVVLAAIAGNDAFAAQEAINQLADSAGAQLASETLSLHPQVSRLESGAPLSIVLLALPALRQMSFRQRYAFVRTLEAFVESDGVVTLSEHALAELVALHLGARPAPKKRPGAAAVRSAMAELLAVLAYCDAADDAAARKAYELGRQHVTLDVDLPRPAGPLCQTLHRALQTCRTALPVVKERLVTAAAYTVSADGVISPVEEEVLRLVADTLECPIPRLDLPSATEA